MASFTEEASYDQSKTDSSYVTQSMSEDLKMNLYTSLKDHGFIDSLKTQIRQKLITSLNEKKGLQRRSQSESEDVMDKATHSLIADFLNRSKYEFTLSVFVSETGLSSEKIYNTKELLQMLKVFPESPVYEKLFHVIRNSGKSFLWSFLTTLSELYVCKTQREVVLQTDSEYPLMPLSEKLQKIDQEFLARSGQIDRREKARIEERMFSYQRDTDQRMEHELQNEIQRYKETALVKMRLEERERLEKEFDAKKKELEHEYRNKMGTVLARERLSFDQMTRQQEVMERESYMRRQTVLEEIDKLREREAQIRREQEQLERERRLLHDKYRAQEEEMLRKEHSIKEESLNMETRLQKEIKKIRTNEEMKYMERWKSLELMETKLKEEQRIQDDRSASTAKMREDCIQRGRLFDEMEVVQYPVLKEENATLRSEVDLLKKRLADIREDYEQEKTKYETILHEKCGPSMEEKILRKDLEATKENLLREQHIWDEQKRSLEKRLQEEILHNKNLLQRMEEQNAAYREMQFEINTFRRHVPHGDGRRLGMTPRSGRTPRSVHRFFYPIPSQVREDGQSPQNNDSREFMGMKLSGQGDMLFQENKPGIDRGDGSHLMDNDDMQDAGSSMEWEDMLQDSKRRLQGLEEETHCLQSVYHDFEHRLLHPEPVGFRRVNDSNAAPIAVHVHYEPANTRAFLKEKAEDKRINKTVPLIPAYPQENYSKMMQPDRGLHSQSSLPGTSNTNKMSNNYEKLVGVSVEDPRPGPSVVTFNLPPGNSRGPFAASSVGERISGPRGHPDALPLSQSKFSQQYLSSRHGSGVPLEAPSTDMGATSRDVGSTEQQLGPQEHHRGDDFINADDTTPVGALSLSEDVLLDNQRDPTGMKEKQRSLMTEDWTHASTPEDSEEDPKPIKPLTRSGHPTTSSPITNPTNEDQERDEDEDKDEIDPVMLRYMERVKAERERQQAAQTSSHAPSQPSNKPPTASNVKLSKVFSDEEETLDASSDKDISAHKSDKDDDNFW